MTAFDFKLNYKGLGEYLAGEDMVELVTREGAKVMAVAKATAPDYEPIGEGYISSFELRVDKRATGRSKTPRACATVLNTSDHAIEVEFGGKATPRHRTLGRAIGMPL